ncbi:MAG TPA: ABC transporter substrate-binding protein [Negativicutes bacterium]|nr:ABC transporter substrate-binding protein [Negativicutes bacterium]
MRIGKSHIQRVFVCVTVIMLLMAVGCGGTQADKKTATSDALAPAVLTIADTAGDWGFPSPFLHYQRGPGYIRMSLLFDTLVWKDAKGFVSALAERWEVSEDGLTYRFFLRQNVKWHDGKPFTSGDVVFTFAYLKKNGYSWAPTPMISKVEAVGEREIKISLTKPYAPFLDNVAATVPILPQHIWQEVKDPHQFIQPAALIGTGPYRLSDYSREQGSYRYAVFDEYYGEKAKFSEIRFVKMSPETAVAALRQKQVDMIQAPPDMVEKLKQEGFAVAVGKHDWVAKLLINHRKPPFDNADFRQALAYAIDRNALVDVTLRGHGQAGNPGLLAKDSPWYNPSLALPYDLDKSAALLRKLGYVRSGAFWEKGGRVLEVELLVSPGGIGVPGSPQERQGEFIKTQLEKAGIMVHIRALDAKAIDSRAAEWNFELALTGHGGLGGDPQVLARMITGDSFLSARWKSNQELTELLAAQTEALDPEKRKQSIFRVQELYAADMPAIPLYYPTWYYAHNSRVPVYFTFQGIANGIPQPFNKLQFIKGGQ